MYAIRVHKVAEWLTAIRQMHLPFVSYIYAICCCAMVRPFNNFELATRAKSLNDMHFNATVIQHFVTCTTLLVAGTGLSAGSQYFILFVHTICTRLMNQSFTFCDKKIPYRYYIVKLR